MHKRMIIRKSFHSPLVKISESDFESHAMRLFHLQANENPVYASFLDGLAINHVDINSTEAIPYLPIEFFKSFDVKTGDWSTQSKFQSSGTTGSVPSYHHVRNELAYRAHAQMIFEDIFGPLNKSIVMALLPSYLERSGSSLISMVEYFIEESNHPASGFYLFNQDELINQLDAVRNEPNVILFGVTFALLELASNYNLDLSHVTLIETGGMKGRGKELTRNQLYQSLSSRITFKNIYSEYGMTELFSQAYGLNGIFQAPPSMQVSIRDINDPFSRATVGSTGGINVIDLANADSCAFIETKDIGRQHANGSFEVLGRMDNSELRGCNLLLA